MKYRLPLNVSLVFVLLNSPDRADFNFYTSQTSFILYAANSGTSSNN